MTWFAQLQQEQKAWVEKNFPGRDPWMPLLGLVEESCHELVEAADDGDKTKDAIGDIMIFMSDFCSAMRFDLEGIVLNATKLHESEVKCDELHVYIGKLAHAYLKKAQGIRGTPKEHDDAMVVCLEGIVQNLCEILDYDVSFQETDLEKVVRPIWEKVRQRDWTKTRKPGDPMYQPKTS